MKLQNRRLVGCAYQRNRFTNHEGYADTTAGSALSRKHDIYPMPLTKKPGEKEKVIRRSLPPVSEMDKE